jgi:hypothetical protein
VQDVREDDDFEGVAARRAAGGVEPVDVPGQQGEQFRAQRGHLLRGREGDRLHGVGHLPHRRRVPGAGESEAADLGDEPLEEHVLDRGARPRERRVTGVGVEGEPGRHQPPRPLPAAPAARLLDEAEPGERPQMVGACGGGLAYHRAGLRRGHRPGKSDRLEQREPGRVRERLQGRHVPDLPVLRRAAGPALAAVVRVHVSVFMVSLGKNLSKESFDRTTVAWAPWRTVRRERLPGQARSLTRPGRPGPAVGLIPASPGTCGRAATRRAAGGARPGRRRRGRRRTRGRTPR